MTISQELKDRVLQRIKDCVEEMLHPAVMKLNIEVSYRTDMGKVAGLAYRGQNRIELNTQLFLANVEDFFANTIPHEVAHILQYVLYPRAKQAHGPEWKAIMRTLGCEPDRCHQYDSSVALVGKKLFRYVCSCEGRVFNLTPLIHKKIVNGSPRTCPQCKTRVIYFPRGD